MDCSILSFYPPLPPVEAVTPLKEKENYFHEDHPPSMYRVTRNKIYLTDGYSKEKETPRKRGRDSDTDIAHMGEMIFSEARSLVTCNEFGLMLRAASQSTDPFMALVHGMTKKAFEKGEYWSCLIALDDGCYLECQLAEDAWTSTAFGESEKGTFRYIELFEHDPATGVTDDHHLLFIRISLNYETGEWNLINKGNNFSGKQSKAWAEEMSRAMKIKECFLADQATVLSSKGKEIAIKVPLQIITGQSYYSPTFSLFDTRLVKKPLLCGVGIGKENKACFVYNQDIEKHRKELLWLQKLKVQKIYDEVLKDRKTAQKDFGKLLKRYPTVKGMTFQQLLQVLYKGMKENNQVLQDYEWVYFNLLNADKLSDNTRIQTRFLTIVDRLYWNMLLVARFDA